MSSPGAIRPLPQDVAAKIKSSTSITHLNGVVLELIKNALDAGARTAFVSVDFKRGSCIVEDDGNGIPPAEFESTGGLGKAHHTSKLQQASAFSHRGLFLASLSSLSLLTITSRYINHQDTNSVIFHHSTPVARLIPAPAHQSLRAGEHGTCVTVNDLFGNMPVRVRSRALALQKSDELDREWDHLRFSLVSLQLANPQLSKLVISDVERSKRISIRTSTSSQGQCAGPSAAEVDLGRIGSILAQSGMTITRNMDSWHTISANIPDLTIQAAICTVPSPSKRMQFISLGNEPVLSRNSSNMLFNEVNRLFSLSDFGNVGASYCDTPATCSPMPDDSGAPSSVGGRSWTKSVNKWPMFYIRVDTKSIQQLSDDNEEPSPDSERSVQRIMDVLGAMIQEFLKQQNLRPRPAKRHTTISTRSRSVNGFGSRDTESASRDVRQSKLVSSTEEALSDDVKLPSFQKPHSVNTGPQFHKWSRVKAAKLPSTLAPSAEAQNLADSNDSHIGNDHPLPGRLTQNQAQRIPCSGQIDMSLQGSRLLPESGGAASDGELDKCIRWVDPHTGKAHLINSRTDQTVNPQSPSAGLRLQSDDFTWAPQRLAELQRPQRSAASTGSLWVDNLLRTWESPTFARTELPVPSIDASPYLDPAKIFHGCHQGIGSLDAAQVAKFKGKLQRQSLATANIIAQVDQKFILAKLESSPNQTAADSDGVLVLIDQHAADERCRVESLFEEMFAPSEASTQIGQVRTMEMEPIVFNVSSTEASLFQKYLDFFREWGIHYFVGSQSEYGEAISIQALPTLIAERCRLEPSLVVDLLRREIWTNEEESINPSINRKKPFTGYDVSLLEDDSIYQARAGSNHAHHSWVQKMSGCPQGIFEILNSRACRSAIMFNDPLGVDECKTLIIRLAKCAFPFQCAHGRPSMVPILDLRSQIGHDVMFSVADMPNSDETDDTTMSFAEAFRARYVH